jgi:hypothetical protein
MPKNYSELSLNELRELLLNNKLVHEHMEQEDYCLIMETELEQPEPDNEVIRLCARALESYAEYAELDKINIDIQKLINNTIPVKAATKRLRFKRALLASAAVVATLVLTQLVALAFGFNLYGYIFNWERERLIAEHEGSTAEFEPIFEVFHDFYDIPDEMKAFVPGIITQSFEFSLATALITGSDSFSYKFVFINNDTILNFYVDKGITVYIQREDDFTETYNMNSREFTFYRAAEQNKVIWVENGVLFDLGANLSVDEIKLIISKL